MTATIDIQYDPLSGEAVVTASSETPQSVWGRVTQLMTVADEAATVRGQTARLSWGAALTTLPELSRLRSRFGFTLATSGEAEERIRVYRSERESLRHAQENLTVRVSPEEINTLLAERGFSRVLTPEQCRDTSRLLSLAHGANFSVPGAGKTTVALALHTLIDSPGIHLLVVAPKNAFGAWDDAISECFPAGSPGAETLIRLEGDDAEIGHLLATRKRFIVSYDKIARSTQIFRPYLAHNAVHLILDEAHRIKAGNLSLRGRALLQLAPLAARRDILTGTPVPNSADDLMAQLKFLWVGTNLDRQITTRLPLGQVLRNLYVRTTKQELGLPPIRRHFVQIPMNDAQLALYGVLREEVLRQLLNIHGQRSFDLLAARRSVMRLLQASTNPIAAIRGIINASPVTERDRFVTLAEAVIDDGDSNKVMEASRLAREIADRRGKVVIWTIFRDTLDRLADLLVDLSPVVIHGGIPVGDATDVTTREGSIRRFHEDSSCRAIIANPAAGSEGISLHRVCHDAIYVDRSYNAGHFLQSLDRIHRLGLRQGTETNVYILQSLAPQGLASIDHAVSRRLYQKLRTMEDVLNDADIRQLALDEDEIAPPIDYDVTLDDLTDLLEQITKPDRPQEGTQA